LLGYRSCNSSFNSNQEEQAEDEQPEEGYEDGIYCASIDYYNPNTGNRNQYVLEVEVENNEVVQINFGNGGWLDSDHMTPEPLDENGECTITSDRNYEYGIQITGQDCVHTDNIEGEEDPVKMYTTAECAAMYNMTKKESKACFAALDIAPNELLSEERCQTVGDYLKEFRALEEIQKAMDEGYIQSTYNMKISEYEYCNQVIVKKYGMYYWLAVKGRKDVSTGTMIFNEEITDWQSVPVRYSPKSSIISVYQMKVMGESSSKAELRNEITDYCTQQF
jgi:hypothetical protein